MASTSLHRLLRLSRLALAAPLAMGLIQPQLQAATIGSSVEATYGSLLLEQSCTLTATPGSLGFTSIKNLISSDNAGATLFGAPAPAKISVTASNVESVTLVAENPELSLASGTLTSHTSLLEFANGSGGYDPTDDVTISATNGEITGATEELNVRFFTSGSDQFGTGTYSAKATVTCTDNGTK